jgi:hypothetical protein
MIFFYVAVACYRRDGPNRKGPQVPVCPRLCQLLQRSEEQEGGHNQQGDPQVLQTL